MSTMAAIHGKCNGIFQKLQSSFLPTEKKTESVFSFSRHSVTVFRLRIIYYTVLNVLCHSKLELIHL